jgi:hypothetical protein
MQPRLTYGTNHDWVLWSTPAVPTFCFDFVFGCLLAREAWAPVLLLAREAWAPVLLLAREAWVPVLLLAREAWVPVLLLARLASGSSRAHRGLSPSPSSLHVG